MRKGWNSIVYLEAHVSGATVVGYRDMHHSATGTLPLRRAPRIVPLLINVLGSWVQLAEVPDQS